MPTRPRGRGPGPAAPIAVLVLTAPLLMASGDEGEDAGGGEWPSAPEPNINESIVEIPFDEQSPFTYGIPNLDDFVRPVRNEEVEGGVTTVTISSDVLFEFDEAELSEGAEETIAEIAAQIEGTSGTVTVVGHTDGVGDNDYNQELSEDRADAVAEALQDALEDGVEIEASGVGSSEPVATESGTSEERAEAQAQNRRVEISYEGS